MRLRILCLIGLMSWCSPLSLIAQDAPMKWGKIPTWQLQTIDEYPADTNAVALVLGDYGTITVESDWSVTFKRHRRIKLLSEAAYDDWGTFGITYYSEDRFERVRNIEGQTITQGPNGKLIRKKLDKKSIFKEKVSDEYERVRFTLPGLEPGAVIEYRYTLTRKNPAFLPTWAFQANEPTLHSELRIEHPQTLAYAFASTGVTNYDVREQEKLARRGTDASGYRWVMKDVPALREEPYMTTVQDHRATIEAQLGEYYDGAQVIKHMRSWPEVAKDLMHEYNMFGKQLGRHRTVREQAKALTAELTDPLEKIQAIHTFIRETIEWDGSEGIFADKDLDDVLKAKVGTGPDLTLLLVDMLRTAGLDAHPILISTRSNGQVVEVYPLLTQFNKVLAYVEVNSKPMVLDVTQRHGPYTLVPQRALSHRGWVVRDPHPAWISLPVKGTYRHQGAIMASLAEDGTLSGTLQASDTEYSALAKRLYLADNSEEDFVKERYLDGLDEVQVDSVSVENMEAVDEVLRTSATFSIPQYAQAVGDFIYVNPFLLSRWEENPFRSPTRTFPVDMAFPRDYVYTLRLTLPEGYEIQDLPRSRRMGLASGGGRFLRSMVVQDGVLTLQARFTLGKSVYQPDQYAELRQFFAEVVAVQSEPLVLQRQNEMVTGDGN